MEITAPTKWSGLSFPISCGSFCPRSREYISKLLELISASQFLKQHEAISKLHSYRTNS